MFRRIVGGITGQPVASDPDQPLSMNAEQMTELCSQFNAELNTTISPVEAMAMFQTNNAALQREMMLSHNLISSARHSKTGL